MIRLNICKLFVRKFLLKTLPYSCIGPFSLCEIMTSSNLEHEHSLFFVLFNLGLKILIFVLCVAMHRLTYALIFSLIRKSFRFDFQFYGK